MDISRIDKNFAAERVSYDGMTVYRLTHEPFDIRRDDLTARGASIIEDVYRRARCR